MKKFIVGAVFLGLVACGQGQQASVQAPAASGASDFSREYTSVVLPANVDFDFGYTLVSERTFVKPENLEVRRGLMLEFLDGDVSSTVKSLADSFKKSGFSSRVVKSGTALILTRKNSPEIYVEVKDVAERKPQSDGAKGSVWISWGVGSLQQTAAE